MPMRQRLAVLACLLPVAAVLTAGLGSGAVTADPAALSDGDRKEIEADLKALTNQLARLPSDKTEERADAEVFAKGVAWALRYDTQFEPADAALLKKALERGKERAAALEAGKRPWAERKGKVVRGFVSAVDGSVQPFGVIVPAGYNPAKPIRLDVVLHGSSKPVGMSELRFMNRFDDGDGEAKAAPDTDYIELHRSAASRTATAGPAKRTFSRRSRRFVAIIPSTATASSCAACQWVRRGRGIWG